MSEVMQAGSIQRKLSKPAEVDAAISAAFVICVESGPLETQSLWAIESLRKWGGRFSACEVIAVTPRSGPPLMRHTRARFKKLGVRHISFQGPKEWSFFGHFNKPLALAAAEELTDADQIIWMDSDVLVVGEPTELILRQGERFAAHPCSCRYDIGSTGRLDDHDPFWVKSLEEHGIAPSHYPMIETQPGEPGPMRMYWQAGVFTYRRCDRLGETFLQSAQDQMKLHIASRYSGTYFHEQLGLAIAVHRLDLNYRILSKYHNFAVNRLRFGDVVPSEMANAKLIHYFGSAWKESFEQFVSLVRVTRPDVADWLVAKGPLRDERFFLVRAINRALRHLRNQRLNAYAAACTSY